MPVLWPPLAIHQKEITGSVINQGNKAHTAIRPRCTHDIMCRISSPFKPRHLSERSFGRMAAEEVSRVGFRGQGDAAEEPALTMHSGPR